MDKTKIKQDLHYIIYASYSRGFGDQESLLCGLTGPPRKCVLVPSNILLWMNWTLLIKTPPSCNQQHKLQSSSNTSSSRCTTTHHNEPELQSFNLPLPFQVSHWIQFLIGCGPCDCGLPAPCQHGWSIKEVILRVLNGSKYLLDTQEQT